MLPLPSFLGYLFLNSYSPLLSARHPLSTRYSNAVLVRYMVMVRTTHTAHGYKMVLTSITSLATLPSHTVLPSPGLAPAFVTICKPAFTPSLKLAFTNSILAPSLLGFDK